MNKKITDFGFDIIDKITSFLVAPYPYIKCYRNLRATCKHFYELDHMPIVDLKTFIDTILNNFIYPSSLTDEYLTDDYETCSEFEEEQQILNPIKQGDMGLPDGYFSVLALLVCVWYGFEKDALRLLSHPKAQELSKPLLERCLTLAQFTGSYPDYDISIGPDPHVFENFPSPDKAELLTFESDWNALAIVKKTFNRNALSRKYHKDLALAIVSRIGISVCANTYAIIDNACLNGDLGVVRFCLDTDLDIFEGTVYIPTAAQGGCSDVVALLLRDSREDPLWNYCPSFRIACGNDETMTILLQDPRLWSIPQVYGEKCYIIHEAYHRHSVVLEQNNIVDDLQCALSKGYPAIASFLIYSAENGYFDIVKLLLQEHRVDPSYEKNAAVRIASRNGQIEIVKLLLQDSRVDPSECMNGAIRLASAGGHTNIVTLLLQDSRVDPSDIYDIALGMACYNGHTDTALLLVQDARVNPSHYYFGIEGNYLVSREEILERASEKGYTEITRILPPDDINDLV